MAEQSGIPPENSDDWILGWKEAAEMNVALLAPYSSTGHWQLYKTPPLPDNYIAAVQGKRFVGITEGGIKSFVPDGPVFVWVEP